MDDQNVNQIDELSNEGNMLNDDLFEDNQQTAPPAHVVDSSKENTSIEEADKKETPPETLKDQIPIKEETPHKDDDTQFEYWQSQSDTKDGELKVLREQIAQREIAPQLTPEITEPLVAPVKPQTEFVDDVQTWANYYEKKDEYRDKLVEENTQGLKTIEQKAEDVEKTRLQGVEAANLKAYNLGELSKQPGYDLEKATRALTWFSRQRESPEEFFKEMAGYYNYIENQTPVNRANQIQQRVDRQNEISPLGVQTSQAETQKVADNEEFFDDVQHNQGHGKY